MVSQMGRDIGEALKFMFIFAILGMIAAVGGGIWLIWFIFNHITIGVA